eukprot:CAMPEP_0201520684 /NCGR_PEP_ID=MMETSP0161_2-20130828/12124_2 /ASSEMBLY_ACC=CAM_ASM_000251 /TAXON_ID=180227 /ORGANISM="Neoparamoeba aestuarina, Strain SoJaBio B1-5/56/2" /LENGTH=179 /DNA_ID=CAMNT_0047919153 /DNA_START=17 /DNA_END=553 /DNA_ORIENTATION=-
MGPLTPSIFSFPNSSETRVSANSIALPGPRLVTSFPSFETTTRSSLHPFGSLSAKAGWQVPSTFSINPRGTNTTAGAAQIAAIIFFISACLVSNEDNVGQSARCCAPGIPPGHTIQSNSFSATSPINTSATRTTPREQVTCFSLATEATVTSAPALRRTSMVATASISSVASATTTRTF